MVFEKKKIKNYIILCRSFSKKSRYEDDGITL
jgi:hypothetical protein